MSERLTLNRLAELRQIAEAATPGPYEVVNLLGGYGGPYALRMPHPSGHTWYGVEGIKSQADAEYFAAVNRNTVLALLDEIERLLAEVERLRKILKDTDNELDILDEDMDTCDHSAGVCMCGYWTLRRKMKAALSKEANHD